VSSEAGFPGLRRVRDSARRAPQAPQEVGGEGIDEARQQEAEEVQV